jgi:hypothetical protein
MKRNEGIVMKSKALGLLAAALMSVSGVVGAAPVLVGTTTDPTGIDALVVDGTTYNVAFSTTTFNTFTWGTTLSTDASQALASALTGLSVISLAGGPGESGGYILMVDSKGPGQDAASCLTGGTGVCAGGASGWAAGGVGLYPLGQFSYGGYGGIPFSYTEAADFTPAPVPIPASIWLILSGLAGLGLASWRRGQTASV